jgi:hypothetical protein
VEKAEKGKGDLTVIVFESPVAPTAKRLQPNPTQLVATQLPVAVAEILR